MNDNKSFQALAWLNTFNKENEDIRFSSDISHREIDVPPPVTGLHGPSNSFSSKKSEFCPIDFLIPGWKGEGLLTKSAAQIKNTLYYLWNDSKSLYEHFHQKNRSLKLSIYDEFHQYALEKNCSKLNAIDNYKLFWEHTAGGNSPFQRELDQFRDIYCYRVVTSYLLKVRFLILLSDELNLSLNTTNILNPTSFLSKFFRKGSSTEIKCKALQTNQYSWYRPSNYVESDINNLIKHFKLISITELMKIFTYVDFNADQENSSIFTTDEDYSHTISHTSFGLFLNQLLLRIPSWLSEGSFPLSSMISKNKELGVETTKFTGNQIASLSLSHWLAQQHNQYKKWDSIIFPHFQGNDYINGEYIRLCHELIFISFLVNISKEQGFENPIELITKTLNEANFKMHQNQRAQMSLLDDCLSEPHRNYDRIVLNLTENIKKNPHHHLLNKINQQFEELGPKSNLIVLTNQNLFVPSQSEKVKNLLSTLKLEASFNFENLKGKGEISNFIYVFSKRNRTANNSLDNFQNKESCLTFKWKGELKQFNRFHLLIEEMENFLDSKGPYSTSIYHKEKDGLIFDFHQDAIVDGKLLSLNASKDGSFTHPNFIKNLTKYSIPLEKFFNIDNISHSLKSYKSSNLLGLSESFAHSNSLILIVNFTNQTNITIELAPISLFQVKIQQYGTAYFHYFRLTPKRNDINVNTFDEYFKSNIGQQVIQLSLQGKTTKLKAKLNSLLVPNFFNETAKPFEIPAEITDIINISSTQISESDPTLIKSEYKVLEEFLESSIKNNPWRSLCLLADFKHKINQCFDILNFSEDPSKQDFENINVIYSNPIVRAPLSRLEGFSLLPKNDEIYLELGELSANELSNELTQTKISTLENDDYCLELISDQKAIVKLYSHKHVLEFIEFILTNASGCPISTILQSLKVPKASELSEILSHFQELPKSLKSIKLGLNRLTSEVFKNCISNIS